MASIQNLPQELFDKITDHVSRRDCKNLRLTSQVLAANALSALVREVHLSPQPLSWHNLERLASNPRFANHVEGFVFFPALLPKFDGYAGWMKCIDVHAVRKHYERCRDDDQRMPVSETLYRAYGDYQRTRESQQDMVARLPEQLPVLLGSFPKLRRLASLNWSQCWRSTPSVEHCGGAICAADELWQFLRPEDPSFKPQLFASPWRSSSAHGYPPDVYHSSITELGLLGASILLPLQDTTTGVSIRCSELELALCLDVRGDGVGNFFAGPRYPHEIRDGPTDQELYQLAWQSCVKTLETSRLPDLRILTMQIQDGCLGDMRSSVLKGLVHLINTAGSLKELHLWLEKADIESTTDLLTELTHFYAPRLRSLSLSSRSGMFASQSGIERILTRHAPTLEYLSISSIWLNDDNEGSWSGLLEKISSLVSLKEIHLDTLYDSTEVGQRGDWNRDTGFYFQIAGSKGQRAMYSYIIDGGSWPGWTEDIYA